MKNNSKIMELANGYVEYPSDWLVLPTEYDSMECEHAAIVSIYGCENAPRAIFPVKNGIDQSWAEKAYQRVWPGYVGLIAEPKVIFHIYPVPLEENLNLAYPVPYSGTYIHQPRR